jgi:hypothetical protein
MQQPWLLLFILLFKEQRIQVGSVLLLLLLLLPLLL